MCGECDRARELYGVGSPQAAHVTAYYHPDAPKPKWKHITWTEFCAWMQGKKLTSTREGEFHSGAQILEFEDESVAVVTSNFEDDWSDVTPGAGIQAPSVCVGHRALLEKDGGKRP